ncbi:MAG TPA: cytochrome c3 family protein [Anaerolineae bacterium]|nr:cytochrome c3 family protein [Anaerolineae bacterium]
MERMFLGLIALMFLGSGLAFAGPYGNSAHGDSATFGVLRTGTNQYARGNCAHCHEQHASIAGAEPSPSTGDAAGPDRFCLLAQNFNTSALAGSYAQDDNACFYCHIDTGYLQNEVILNYDYSATFGNASIVEDSIFELFNKLSSHDLNNVLTFAKANWSSTFKTGSNPCSACHNVHKAKQNKANPGDPTYTAISKPSAHDELWGDSAGEKLSDYTSYYRPPYSKSTAPVKYEPDMTASEPAEGWGSNMPDYITFCQDCHSSSMTGSPYSLPNTPIDWSSIGGEAGGDKHGTNVATASSAAAMNLLEPYATAWDASGLVLSCTDCHEPHGSKNLYLVRRRINGGVLGDLYDDATSQEMRIVCYRCHNISGAGMNYTIHHQDADAPYKNAMGCGAGGGCHSAGNGAPIDCNTCHYHGGQVSNCTQAPATRRTF